MPSLKSLKQNPARPAALTYGSYVNKHADLGLPQDRLVIMMDDIPSLTDAAIVHPVKDPTLLASVQELVIIDESVAVHMTLDVQALAAADFLVQSIVHGFCLVLVDPLTRISRTVTLKDSNATRISEAQARSGMPAYGSEPSQAEAYVACVARIGYHGCSSILKRLQSPRSPSQIFFRPIFGEVHEEFRPASLDELVAVGRNVPTLNSFGGHLLGAGTLEEMLATAESYAKPRH